MTRNERLLQGEIDRIHAALPDCPTCAGYPLTEYGKREGHDPCPDCLESPGQVSVAQMAALWQAVHDDGLMVISHVWREGDEAILRGAELLATYLRAVRP